MKRTDHDGVGHRDDGLFLPPTSAQTLVQVGQIHLLRLDGCMGDLGQVRAQGAITLAGLARPLFPRTFIIARGHPHRGRQATGRAKARISVPYSATNSSVPRWSTLGMASSRVMAPVKLRGVSPVASGSSV